MSDGRDGTEAEAPVDTDPAENVDGDTAEGPADNDDDSPEDDPGREAARYRRRLREAEAARDDLAARVEALQRQHVGQLLDGHALKAEALFATVQLSELLAEDGSVDPAKVTEAVAAARERFGIARPSKGSVIPGVGNQPDRLPKVDRWLEAFKPSRRR